MTRFHRACFWLALLYCAIVAALIARSEPHPWPSGDGDRVEIREESD